MKHLLQLIPAYHARVWGGQRLRAAEPPVGEAWVVHEHNRVAAGAWAGRTLAEVTAEQGAALLGERVFQRTGARFPLLIKLLDCRDWLSVQVHPNDEQAAALEGPGHFGKTEAWHILEAEAGARLIAGVKPGATSEAIAHAIRAGSILDWAQYHSVQAGDTLFMPAGTLHALGPGLLLYEVQQTSDITYRVFDWNRPASAGRALHIEPSVAVADAAASGERHAIPAIGSDDQQRLVACPYFSLDMLTLQRASQTLAPRGQSFHALTVIDGQVAVACAAEVVTLNCFETVVVPAACEAYDVRPLAKSRVLKASVDAIGIDNP